MNTEIRFKLLLKMARQCGNIISRGLRCPNSTEEDFVLCKKCIENPDLITTMDFYRCWIWGRDKDISYAYIEPASQIFKRTEKLQAVENNPNYIKAVMINDERKTLKQMKKLVGIRIP